MRKVKRVKAVKVSAKKAKEYNKKALWKAYKELQMRSEKAWHTFRDHVRKNAKADVLVRDHNHLLLLLGECNYMARECTRMAKRSKSRR